MPFEGTYLFYNSYFLKITADANASISDTNAHSQPRCLHATVAASIPLHTLPYRMAHSFPHLIFRKTTAGLFTLFPLTPYLRILRQPFSELSKVFSYAAARTASPWASRACAPARCPSPRGRSRTSTKCAEEMRAFRREDSP